MLADRLRKSLLQAAITGQLTEQLPTDDDARDLLKKICAEKAKLVAEKKIKTEKPLPTISDDEIPFNLPDTWCWCRLNDLYRFIDYRGKTPTKINSGIPLVTAKNVKTGYNDYANREYISEEEYKARQSRGVSHKGDILFTTEAPLGNVSLADLEIFSAGQRVITFQAYCENLISNRLVMFFLLAEPFQKTLHENKTGTTVAGIKAEKLKNLIVPLPPLAEQKQIVTRLEELLAEINELARDERELIELEKIFPRRMKNSLLQAAIQGRLTEQLPTDGDARDLLRKIRAEKKIKAGRPLPPVSDEEVPFDIPDNWCWCRLGEVCQINPRNKPEDENVDATFLPMASIDEGYGSSYKPLVRQWTEIKSGFTHFSDGDVILAKITPCFQNRKSALVRDLKNGIGAGTTELYVLRSYSKLVDRKYLLYFVKNQQFISDGLATMKGTAGQQRVSRDFITNYLFPLPPLAEQKRIVERLNEMLPLCEI